MAEIAKESGHWYDGQGNPTYTQPNKSKPGETRPTTIRDAKKLNLFPSVTTIMKIVAAPGLERWKQQQILMAAATLPRIDNESADDWCKRVVIDAGEHGKEAREKGTAIHGAIEKYYQEGMLSPGTEYFYEVKLVAGLIDSLNIQHVSTEKSFASPYGFGGKVDFEGVDNQGRPVVIDFKTQDFKGKGKKQYPEMINQLAAYSVGLEKSNARLINIFISRNLEIPEVDVYEWTNEECCDGWEKFQLVLKLWQLEKKYKPQVK